MRMLYLDLDTLRPDRLGCYGYERNTSPNIDSIAAEGTLFKRYYTSDAPCLPSRAAFMSGTFGIHNGAINHGGTNADMRLQGETRHFRAALDTHSLPAYLRNNGFHTCYIGGFAERHSLYTYYSGFREIHDTGKGGMESAEDVTPTIMEWLEAHGKEDNWYLHVNYWDSHTPYRAPAEFGNPFADAPLPSCYTQELIDAQQAVPGPHTIQDIAMYDNSTNPAFPRQPGEVKDMEGMRELIDGYDCGTAYMDSHIGQILDWLKKADVYDDLVIVVSSDHGENLGEMGMYAEHGTADDVTCHIPMIIRWPGKGASGHVDEGFHYNIDHLPTLADMLGTEPRPQWDGRSYAPSLTDKADTGRDELILSQCCHGAQRAARWDNYIYIRTYHDGYHLFPTEMLYDLKADPMELNNLADERPDLCKEGAWRLMNWHDEQMHSQPYGYHDDPLWQVVKEVPEHARYDLEKYCRRLEATGRGESAAKLREKYPEMLK